MTELQIFDRKGSLRAITDDELASLPPDRRECLNAVIVSADDVRLCEEMIDATRRSLAECNQVLAEVKANIPKISRIDAVREWINSTKA